MGMRSQKAHEKPVFFLVVDFHYVLKKKIWGVKFFFKSNCYFCEIQKLKDFYLFLNYEQAAISDISTPKKHYVKLIINKFDACKNMAPNYKQIGM